MKKQQSPVFHISEHCSDKDIRSIKISAFSEEACTIAEFEENHRHEYYEIIWLKKGKGVHTIDMVNYPYAGSVVFLLSPGQMHQIQPREKAEGYLVKFLPSLFAGADDLHDYLHGDCLFDNIQARPIVSVTAAAHAQFDDILKKMEAEFNADEVDKERVLLAYLKILITHIDRLKKKNCAHETVARDMGLRLFQEYKAAIEKHFRQEHSVQAYAKMLFTEVRTLNAHAKKHLGKTAGEVLTGRIFLEARRELYYNTKSVKEIGYGLGFEDPAYFTRFFKRHAGVSPAEYRSGLQLPDAGRKTS